MTNLAQRVRERLAFDEPSAIKFCDSCEDGFLDHESFQRGCRWYSTTHVKGLEKLFVSMAEGLDWIAANSHGDIKLEASSRITQLEQWLKDGE